MVKLNMMEKTVKFNFEEYSKLKNKFECRGFAISCNSTELKGCYTLTLDFEKDKLNNRIIIIIQEVLRDRNYWCGSMVCYNEFSDIIRHKTEVTDFDLQKVIDVLDSVLNNIL